MHENKPSLPPVQPADSAAGPWKHATKELLGAKATKEMLTEKVFMIAIKVLSAKKKNVK